MFVGDPEEIVAASPPSFPSDLSLPLEFYNIFAE